MGYHLITTMQKTMLCCFAGMSTCVLIKEIREAAGLDQATDSQPSRRALFH
ncbi:cellobiose-specific phosphotransferase system component IIB [Endozoicomonas sp. NE40]|uniref:Cellobiose-specific phosphotransferase system component IIB n=1 Tax=Endozoicomonas lisbonensis TaxID=3120522 RepID=A0ABV2SQT5_9GAMM